MRVNLTNELMRRVKYNMTTMQNCKVEFSNYPKLKQRTMLQMCVLHTMYTYNNVLHTIFCTPCPTMQHSRHPGDTIAIKLIAIVV